MAKSKIMIDNSKVRVTEWVFDLGDETGQHVGIIPRTIEKIFEETNGLVEKGWKYKMEASFLGK